MCLLAFLFFFGRQMFFFINNLFFLELTEWEPWCSLFLPSTAKALLGLFCYSNSNCVHLCSHSILSSYQAYFAYSSKMNAVERLVSMPAVRAFVGSALTVLWLS